MRMQVAPEHLFMVPGQVLTNFHRNDPVSTWEHYREEA
jgi:endonuclease I